MSKIYLDQASSASARVTPAAEDGLAYPSAHPAPQRAALSRTGAWAASHAKQGVGAVGALRGVLVPGDKLAGHELTVDHPGTLVGAADADRVGADPAETGVVTPGSVVVPPGGRPARSGIRRLRGTPGLWLSIFGVSLGLFIIRFLIPTPAPQAANPDGPRP